MKRHQNYLYAMLAGFGAISLSILFFFLLYRYQGFGSAISSLCSILMPFIYGGVIAYMLKSICNWLEQTLSTAFPRCSKKTVGTLSVVLSMLIGLLIVYALIIMILPSLFNSIMTLTLTLQSKTDQFIEWFESFFEDNSLLQNYISTIYDTLSDSFNDWMKNTLTPYMTNFISGVGLGVWNVIIVLKNIFIGLVVALYLLSSRKRFARQAKMLLYSFVKPLWADKILHELAYADEMFSGFISGKILDSAIIGVLCYIVCLIAGFPSPLLISAIIGVTNVIPFFGPFIGAVPATLLILIEDPIKALWFVLFILVLQQLDGNIIGPKILGSSTGLSSFWVLFSILLFGGLWGFVGMIIGVPLFAVIYDIIKKMVALGLERHDCSDLLDAYREEFKPEEAVTATPAPVEQPKQ